jgi:diguanylate cyclase (GGDEF)-like protein
LQTCFETSWYMGPEVGFLVGLALGVVMLSLWVARLRDFPGRDTFVITHVGMLWWLSAAALEMAAPTADCKLVFATLAWPGIIVVPMFWSIFLWRFGNSSPERFSLRKLWPFLTVIAIACALAVSNPWHGLLYGAQTHLASDAPGAQLIYHHGPLFYAFASFLYVFLSFGVMMILRATILNTGTIRRQFQAFLGFTLFAIVTNLSYLFGGVTLFGFDPTPFSFSVTLAAFTWLITNKQLFDVVPVATRVLLERLPDPVIVIDAANRVVSANPAACALAEPGHCPTGIPLSDWPRYGRRLAAMIGRDARAQQSASGENLLLPIGDPPAWFEIQTSEIVTGSERDTVLLGQMIYLRDVTRLQEAAVDLRQALETSQARLATISDLHTQLQRQSVRDPLTQLFNRRYLDVYFKEHAALARGSGKGFALALVDIDHFKRVNDRHGHLAGDDLLKGFADRLRACAGENGAAFRIGGEEFLVAMPGTDRAAAIARLEDFRERNREPVATRAGALPVSFSAGLVGLEADGEDLDALLIRADRRLYAAKRSGRDRVATSDREEGGFRGASVA